MSNEELQNLLSERNALLNELSALPHIVRASIFEKYDVCSRPGCKCHKGEKHGPHACFKVSIAGRQLQKYIPKGRRKQAEVAVSEYRRALQIIDRITAINLELICSKDNNGKQ
ncbi:MAG: hypothetical protein PHW17_13810 [Desulfobacterales bacterium]|mgnify:FL=1|jgi:hypothetical protein|nr:hypothetical protein [Desulfobacterales bacterium]MDD4465049.1 hypothetical protein [Desulfobacterales bacterium]